MLARKFQRDALAGGRSPIPEGCDGDRISVTHPLLSIDAMSTFNWSFDQDLALWRDMGVRHAGLLISKIEDNPAGKFARLRAAGIQSSTVIVNSFDLRNPGSWDKTRATH